MSELRSRVQQEVRNALRARDKERVGALRLIDAEILKYQVDHRTDISAEDFTLLLNRLRKQRNESMEQYKKAVRMDLYRQEEFEKKVIEEFLPEQLGDEAVKTIVLAAIAENGVQDIRDMGKVMATLKPRLLGKADMGKVSRLVREELVKR